MAFGFPAYYQQIVSTAQASAAVIEGIKKSLTALQWKLNDEDENYLSAKCGASEFTLGERIEFDVREDFFAIRSHCLNPLQFVDFGKNKKNVESFLATFHQLSKPQ